MGTGPPLRHEDGPDVSPGPGLASKPLPPGEGGACIHVLPTPPASFPAGELPQPQEQPEMLGHSNPSGEAAGGTGGPPGSGTGSLLCCTGCPVPDK